MYGSHRKTSPRRAARLVRASLIASAGLAALTSTVPGTALAATPAKLTMSATTFPGVHVDTTSAVSSASPLRTSDTRVAFDVHQYGDTVGAGADNRAIATAKSCNGTDHCRSVALAFQIITMGGSHLHLQAGNSSRAVNANCTACQTMAGAYQFVLDTPEPIMLDAATLTRLHGVQSALEEAARTEDPVTLRATADALAQQVVAILRAASAHVTTPAATRDGFPAAPAAPTVTLHRLTDGVPGS